MTHLCISTSNDPGRDDAQFSSDIIWEAVPFLPGHWIVNLGTDLFRWTQQRSAVDGAGCKPCKATLHRVVPAPGAIERYSMPFFYEANLDTPDPCYPYKKRCLLSGARFTVFQYGDVIGIGWDLLKAAFKDVLILPT